MRNKIEIILCAAIWYRDESNPVHRPINTDVGTVVCGHRHPHCIGTYSSLTGKRTNCTEHEQGFLTSKNRFVSREEAAMIAYATGQIDQPKKELYSEDLY